MTQPQLQPSPSEGVIVPLPEGEELVGRSPRNGGFQTFSFCGGERRCIVIRNSAPDGSLLTELRIHSAAGISALAAGSFWMRHGPRSAGDIFCGRFPSEAEGTWAVFALMAPPPAISIGCQRLDRTLISRPITIKRPAFGLLKDALQLFMMSRNLLERT